jgi:Terminase large subunit, T4likevirus-type, N-terminal
MPWQRLVADVALEVDPATGLLAYRKIVLTVPRQSGKTTLLLASMVHRALGFGERQRIVYTAQTRLKARQKWEDEHLVVLKRSPFAALFKPRMQIGQEAIRWSNGSIHGLDAPTEDAAHGDTLDLGVIDEAFAQEDDRVEQGMKPAMLTRPQAQLWVLSTAGKSKSAAPYLWAEVEAGRLAVEAGITSGGAYFEWSAFADADPADPQTWYGCMPALGITQPENAVRSDYETWTAKGRLNEFRRGCLNQWPDETPAEWLVIGRQAWMALEDPQSQIVDRPAFCVAVTSDRTWAAIGAAGCRADGRSHVEVVQHRRGTSWVVPWLKERQGRWVPCAVVIAPSGPAGSLIAEAEAAGIEVLKQSVREVAHGCASLYDATGANPKVDTVPWLRHLGQPELDAAVAGASKRDLGDAWLWSLKATLVDPSPLIAVTGALWGHIARGHEVEESAPPPDIF